ncbi:MAG: carboxymuconolactone decarboxylase family protein [Alphaproteobacteria bacterium]|nr:carboxymuconolactone decarboxylase family protein [Alphaproteobacteria bacterium]
MKDYRTIAEDFHSGLSRLGKDIPQTIGGFGNLASGAVENGTLSTKVKELIAFAIAISARCDGCLAHHSQAVFKAGATRQEVAEMIGVAILMGGGPSSVYGVEAMHAYDTFSNSEMNAPKSA